MTNSKANKGRIIAITVILAMAIAGLLAIDTEQATADQNSATTASETATPVEMTSSALTSSALPSLVRMASALVIVIACIYGGIFLLRYFTGHRRGRRGQAKILEVLETTSVAPKKTVSLIRVADKSVLVGITDTGMSLLTELSPEETAVLCPAIVEEEPSPESDFANTLGNAFNRLRRTTRVLETKAALDS